jgi:hypothetical protein
MEPALAKSVRFTAGRMNVMLDDGREISIPLDRFPRLQQASPAQRRKWQISAFGTGIRWPDIDEDIGVAGILGVPEELIDEAAGFTIHRRRR